MSDLTFDVCSMVAVSAWQIIDAIGEVEEVERSQQGRLRLVRMRLWTVNKKLISMDLGGWLACTTGLPQLCSRSDPNY